MNELRLAARRSLEANLEKSGNKIFLTAGRHQFRSLWTRDFCFAARGLALAGHAQIVEDQLEQLLLHLRDDGSVPRSLDSFSTQLRVVLAPVYRPALGPRLKPEYLGEHGTPAADSAPLLILESLRYKNLRPLLAAKLPALLRNATEFPMQQARYSDWQDSAQRTGPTFYLNLLWWAAARALQENGLTAPRFERSALADFGVYSSLGDTRIAFDATLLGFRFGYWTEGERARVWQALRDHPIWRNRPGVPVSKPYADHEISWTTKLVGLRGYHDHLSWTWILALALGVAQEQGDQEEFQRLANLIVTDGWIAEVLDPDHGFRPFRSLLYRAERPFSWGAGLLFESTHTGGT